MKVRFNKLKFLLVGISALAIMAFTLNTTPPKITTMPPVEPSTTQEVIDAANTFKATLTATQVSSCFLTYSLTDAAKWSNFPIGIYD